MARKKYDAPFEPDERDPTGYDRQVVRSEIVELRHDIARLTAAVKADIERVRSDRESRGGGTRS